MATTKKEKKENGKKKRKMKEEKIVPGRFSEVEKEYKDGAHQQD